MTTLGFCFISVLFIIFDLLLGNLGLPNTFIPLLPISGQRLLGKIGGIASAFITGILLDSILGREIYLTSIILLITCFIANKAGKSFRTHYSYWAIITGFIANFTFSIFIALSTILWGGYADWTEFIWIPILTSTAGAIVYPLIIICFDFFATKVETTGFFVHNEDAINKSLLKLRYSKKR